MQAHEQALSATSQVGSSGKGQGSELTSLVSSNANKQLSSACQTASKDVSTASTNRLASGQGPLSTTLVGDKSPSGSCSTNTGSKPEQQTSADGKCLIVNQRSSSLPQDVELGAAGNPAGGEQASGSSDGLKGPVVPFPADSMTNGAAPGDEIKEADAVEVSWWAHRSYPTCLACCKSSLGRDFCGPVEAADHAVLAVLMYLVAPFHPRYHHRQLACCTEQSVLPRQLAGLTVMYRCSCVAGVACHGAVHWWYPQGCMQCTSGQTRYGEPAHLMSSVRGTSSQAHSSRTRNGMLCICSSSWFAVCNMLRLQLCSMNRDRSELPIICACHAVHQ